MGEIAIVIAENEGGLDSAKGKGYKIIAGTKREFTSLTTHSDVSSADFGFIDKAKSGWIALAERL